MKNTCDYCKNKIKNKYIMDSPEYSHNDNDAVQVSIFDDQLKVNAWFDSCVGIDTPLVKINFCPMCGRKLDNKI